MSHLGGGVLKKTIKNNRGALTVEKFDLQTYIKKNKATVIFIAGIVVFFAIAIFAPQTFSFAKQKADSSAFGSYKYPDKNSLNSSMPTRVIWHEPFFMDKKK